VQRYGWLNVSQDRDELRASSGSINSVEIVQ
jgi:hypothetical protein